MKTKLEKVKKIVKYFINLIVLIEIEYKKNDTAPLIWATLKKFFLKIIFI